MGVISSTHQYPIRRKLLEHWSKDRVDRVGEDVAGRVGRESHVDREARPGALTRLVDPTTPGVKRELMDSQVKDVGAVIERLLGPVTVMHVPIEDRHPFSFGNESGGTDRDVVEDAEPSGRGGTGMVARRTDRQKGRIAIAATQVVDRRQTRARCTQRCLPRFSDNGGIRIQLSAPRSTRDLDAFHVLRLVNGIKRLDGCRRRIAFDYLQSRGPHSGKCRSNPVGPLRMAKSAVVQQASRMGVEQDRHTFTLSRGEAISDKQGSHQY